MSAHSDNTVLRSLPSSELETLAPVLKVERLHQHTVLCEPRSPVATVYFPHNAAISLVIPFATGDVVEAGCVGRDGVFGVTALNGGTVYSRAVVQLEGNCSCSRVSDLMRVLPSCPTLQRQLSRHEEALLAQAQQSAACNASHQLLPRMARWLLRARDLSGSNEFHLTQEYMSQMLGVRRTSVSLAASALQHDGVLAYRRGSIKLEKPEVLEEMACECYGALKAVYSGLSKATTDGDRAP